MTNKPGFFRATIAVGSQVKERAMESISSMFENLSERFNRSGEGR